VVGYTIVFRGYAQEKEPEIRRDTTTTTTTTTTKNNNNNTNQTAYYTESCIEISPTSHLEIKRENTSCLTVLYLLKKTADKELKYKYLRIETQLLLKYLTERGTNKYRTQNHSEVTKIPLL
jgi:hypothetical protein